MTAKAPALGKLIDSMWELREKRKVAEAAVDELKGKITEIEAEIEALMDNEIDTHHHEEHGAVAAVARLAGALPAFHPPGPVMLNKSARPSRPCCAACCPARP